MRDYAYTIFSLFGVIICSISVYFIWRVPGRPWSTLFLISWLFTYNIFASVDSIVWAGDNLVDSPDGVGYCDVSSRVKTIFPIGVLGSTISVCLFLLGRFDQNGSQTTHFRRNILDVSFGLAVPVLFVVLKFLVEPSRYIIFGVIVCQGTFDTSWPAIPLYFIWPLIFTLIAFAMIGSSLLSKLIKSSLCTIGICVDEILDCSSRTLNQK